MGASRKSGFSLREVLFALFCAGAITAYYLVQVIHLFPMSEYRDWISWPMSADHYRAGLTNILLVNQTLTRDVSLIYTRLTGAWAGLNVYWLNVLNLLPFPITCLSIYSLGRQLKLDVLGSGVVLGLWAFSLPVIDALVWQATIHDRLAMMFSCLCINVMLTAFEFPYGRLRCLLANGMGLLLLVLAYNSKESAFFLVPSLIALAVLNGMHRGKSASRTDIAWRLSYILAPVFYGLYHNARYFRNLMHDQTGWNSHVIGRSWGANSLEVLHGQLGISPALAVGLMVVLVALSCLILVRPSARTQSFSLGTLGWLGITFLLSATITLQTQYSDYYYQYIPRLWIALFVTYLMHYLMEKRDRNPASRVRGRMRSAVQLVILGANFFGFFSFWAPQYAEHLMFSRNFQASFRIVRQHVLLQEQPRLKLVAPQPEQKVFRLCLGPEAGLYRLMFDQVDLARGGNVEAITGVGDTTAWQAPADGVTYLVYDKQMNLHAIYVNGKKVFSP